MSYAVSIPAASRSAIFVLRSVNREIDATQLRLSTGKKVNSAADNPTAWMAAKGMESENRTSSTLRSGIDMAASRAATASQSLGKAVDLLTDMKAKMLAATAPGADRAAIAEDLKGIKAALSSLVAGSSMGGENWLSGGGTKSVAIGSGAAGVITTSVDLAKADLGGKLTTAGVSTVKINDMAVPVNAAEATAYMDDIESVVSDLKSAAGSLGATAKRFEGQSTFLKTIETIRESAISDLVNADMEEETARLEALQVRQQLAQNALAISNASMRNILRLFQ